MIFKLLETKFKMLKAILEVLESISNVLKSIFKVLKLEITKFRRFHSFHRLYHAISDGNFCGREFFSKISVGNSRKIARNLALRSMPTLGTVAGDLIRSQCSSGTDFGAVSRRFRPQNIAAAEKISKFSVRNPLEITRNRTRRSMPTLATMLWDLCRS